MSVGALLWVLDHAPCPTSSAFAVLVVYANFANEHGRSYPAASTIAAKTTQNIKTVRAAIGALQDAGLLIDTGRRVGGTGNIPVYALAMEGVPKVGTLKGESVKQATDCPQEPATGAPIEAVPNTGRLPDAPSVPNSGPKPTQIRVREPVSGTSTPKDASHLLPHPGRKPVTGSAIEDWQVPAIADLPDAQRCIVEQWEKAQPGAYRTEAAGHRAFVQGRGRRRGDVGASWLARIVQIGAKPLRDAKAGLKLGGAVGIACGQVTAEQRVAAAERRDRLDRLMGRTPAAENTA